MFGLISVRCVTCLWNDLVYCCCVVLVRKLAGLCASAEEVQGSQKSVIQAATASGTRESSVWNHATTTWFRSLPTSGNKVTTSPDQLKKRREENRSQFCVLDRIGHQSVQAMMCAEYRATIQRSKRPQIKNKSENSIHVLEDDDGSVCVCSRRWRQKSACYMHVTSENPTNG